MGLGDSSVGKMFVTQQEDLPPTKKKKLVAVSSYNHSAGEAETDGSLGTLSVNLTYLVIMKFSDILSQKLR